LTSGGGSNVRQARRPLTVIILFRGRSCSWASPRFPALQCLPASASTTPGIGRGCHWQGIRPISTPCLGPENMPLLRSIRVHTCILLLVHSPPPSPSASRPPPLGRPDLGHLHNIPPLGRGGDETVRCISLRARRDGAKHPNLSAAKSERWDGDGDGLPA
jgi:hypothetical protein